MLALRLASRVCGHAAVSAATLAAKALMRAISWYGELDRPALFERPEIGNLGLEHDAGLTVAIANGYFDTRALLVNHQIVGVEAQEVELGGNEAEPRERRLLAAAQAAKGIDLGRDINHMREIVWQIARKPIEILRPPRVIDVRDDGLRLGHDPLTTTTN